MRDGAAGVLQATGFVTGRRVKPFLALLAGLGLLTGCADRGNPPPTGTAPGGLCETLRLGASAGAPGDLVPLTGVPATGQLAAQVTAVGAAEPSRVFVAQEPGGAPGRTVFVVPVHPTAPFAGGPVTLAFTDGSQTCPSQPFEVAGLPDPNAPEVKGTLERQAAAVQASLASQARALGVDPASLQGDLAALPAEALPLGLAQFFVDHPQNPNSLVAVARRGGVANGDTFEPFDRALMDALAYQFGFMELQNGELQNGELQAAAFAEDCVGPAALSSPQQLNNCMNLSQNLQTLYDELALQAQIVTYALVPVVTAFPALGVPALFIGYTYYFLNSVVLISAQTSPRMVEALEFTATPTAFTGPAQSGVWSRVLVTVADNSPLDIAELIKGMIDAADFGALVPVAGPVFDLYISVVLGRFKEVLEDDLNRVAVPYSTFGPVDITAYGESYNPSVAYGNELRVVSEELRSYAPSTPFRAGRVDLILAVSAGYFNDSTVQGARQITVGEPTEADESFVITAVDAPPIPWNSAGDVNISWAGEGIVFPVNLRVRVADCSDFDECDLTGGTFENRANPLVYPVGCETNDPALAPDTVSVTFSLEDGAGKVTPPQGVTIQCGTSNRLHRQLEGSDGRRAIRTGPFRR